MRYGIEKTKEIAEIFDVQLQWAIERRKKYFENEISYCKEHERKIIKFISSANFETRDFIFSSIEDSQKKIQKLEREFNLLVNGSRKKRSGITPEMIERAREYPIENLIQVKRGMALCPFHNDKKPSLSIRGNLFHCFGCGEKGGSITFVMKREGLSFGEAVKLLNSY